MMLSIIIMILVVLWFASKAKGKGRNALLWGAIGAVSYYLPVFIVGNYISPQFIKGFMTAENQNIITIVAVALPIVTGIICCYIAWNILMSKKPI